MKFTPKVVLVSEEQIFTLDLRFDAWRLRHFYDFHIKAFLLDVDLYIFLEFLIVNHEHNIYFETFNRKQ